LIVKDNFSTAAILFFICLMILFIGKVPMGKLTIVVGSGIALISLVIGLHLIAPGLKLLPRYETWQNRIINMNENENNMMANAQALNAQLAIYNGGALGQGPGDGKLKEYLPEAYADFYYSSFVEEFGSISSVILILLYLILLFRIFQVGLNAESLFELYTCLGIGILLLMQAIVNMLVCTGIFPVTGQNMPLLAMGGSAIIMTGVALGIVQSIANKQNKGNNSETDSSKNQKSGYENEYET